MAGLLAVCGGGQGHDFALMGAGWLAWYGIRGVGVLCGVDVLTACPNTSGSVVWGVGSPCLWSAGLAFLWYSGCLAQWRLLCCICARGWVASFGADALSLWHSVYGL